MTFQFRSFDPRPATLDPTARTVLAIASTFADVQRPGFVERLDPKGCDLSRLIGGPVLDGHQSATTRDQLGVIEEARITDHGLIVKLRFRSNEAALSVLRDIADGTLRGLSLGYRVSQWRPTRENGVQVRVAVAWQPVEVSIVPIPADPGAAFRSDPTITQKEEVAMPATETTTTTPEAGAATITRAEEAREIRSIAQLSGLGDAWALDQIEAEANPEAARQAAFAALATRQAETRTTTTRAAVGFSHDDPNLLATRAGEALFARLNPGHELSAPARQFAGLGLADLAGECLRRAHIPTTGMSPETRITRAMTTSDFPLVTGDFSNRVMLQGYAAAPSGLKPVARQISVPNFHDRQVIGLGSASALQKVNEAGEITSGTFEEEGQKYRIASYARMFSLSFQALTNGDAGLNAWADIPRKLGMAAAELEAQLLVDLVTANAALSDGVALYHATHGNLKTGLAQGSSTFSSLISHALLGMRRQKDPGGAYVAAEPKFIVCSPEDEAFVMAGLADVFAPSAEEVNLYRGKLTLLVDPRLSQGSWYCFAAPSAVPCLELATLNGQGPQVEARQGWNTLGQEFRVVHHVGAGVVDHRGTFRLDFAM